jgi:hypothetical protein
MEPIMSPRYTKDEKVVGILPVGMKAIWEKTAKEDGFNRLFPWVRFVVWNYIKQKDENTKG